MPTHGPKQERQKHGCADADRLLLGRAPDDAQVGVHRLEPPGQRRHVVDEEAAHPCVAVVDVVRHRARRDGRTSHALEGGAERLGRGPEARPRQPDPQPRQQTGDERDRHDSGLARKRSTSVVLPRRAIAQIAAAHTQITTASTSWPSAVP